jgi:uncharacterized protein YgbK (DUF1537 family)
MIVAVIADDLTGAAELAGAAAGAGCTAEVHTRFDPSSDADVIAVDTGTRCMSSDAASPITAAITRDVLRAKPRWIYKKTDSVLRGHVRDEIREVLAAVGLSRALLVPANPSKGRTIRGGVYAIDGVPLAQTAFAHDPDHPRRSSDVRELLDGGDDAIEVPDVCSPADLSSLAARVNDQTLAAGGVEFFQALLRRHHGHRSPPAAGPLPDCVDLLVCGSAQACGQGRAADCQRLGVPVVIMPDPTPYDWSDDVRRALAIRGRAMVAIGPDKRAGAPTALAAQLAESIAAVIRATSITTMGIEGGATAAAILRTMGWTRLTALPSPDLDGVTALRPIGATAPAPLLLVKPGSYPWPDRIWPRP